MEELLKIVSEKTGLPAEQAQGAIEAVLGFLKDKLPGPVADQIDGVVGGGDDGGGITGQIGGIAKDLLGND